MRRLARVAMLIALHAVTTTLLVVWLAWLTGRVLSDRWGWSQWLSWIPTQATIFATLVALALAFRPGPRVRTRRRRIGWATLALMTVFSFGVLEHRLLHRAPDAEGLRLVHWNLTERLFDPEAPFAQELIELDGDLTVLTNAGGAPWSDAVRDWLGSEARPRRRRPFTVLTRRPIGLFRTVVVHEEISIALLEIDTPLFDDRRTVFYLVDLPSDPRLPRGGLARAARAELEKLTLPPADIVIGDFNLTRGSFSLKTMFPAHHHAYDDGGHGYGASFHRDWRFYHIDHVLLSPELEASRYDLVPRATARHAAQVAWIRRAR